MVEFAQGQVDRWFQQGINALKMARFATEEEMPRDAAFMRYQAAERFLFAVILVDPDYKPKTHSIGALSITHEVGLSDYRSSGGMRGNVRVGGTSTRLCSER